MPPQTKIVAQALASALFLALAACQGANRVDAQTPPAANPPLSATGSTTDPGFKVRSEVLSPRGDFKVQMPALIPYDTVRLVSTKSPSESILLKRPSDIFGHLGFITRVIVSPDEKEIFLIIGGDAARQNTVYLFEQTNGLNYKNTDFDAVGSFSRAAWHAYHGGNPYKIHLDGRCDVEFVRQESNARVTLYSAEPGPTLDKKVATMTYDTRGHKFIHVKRFGKQPTP